MFAELCLSNVFSKGKLKLIKINFQESANDEKRGIIKRVNLRNEYNTPI